MNITMSKITRFILNLVLYASILISTTYYSYTNVPELYGVKNVLVPFNGALFLAVVLSIILSGVNEITTIFVIRFIGRRKA